MTGAIFLCVKATMFSAASTRLPLIRSRTSFAFCGLERWKRASARNSGVVVLFAISNPYRPVGHSSEDQTLRLKLLRLGGVAALGRVALEGARRGELAKLVPHHVFCAVHRDELLSVVYRDRVADHVGMDRRAARPGADDLLIIGRVQCFHLHHQVRVDERALLCRACHSFTPGTRYNESREKRPRLGFALHPSPDPEKRSPGAALIHTRDTDPGP